MNAEGVKSRYEKVYDEDKIRENIYSLINPVGRYDYYATAKILSWYIEHLCGGGSISFQK